MEGDSSSSAAPPPAEAEAAARAARATPSDAVRADDPDPMLPK